MWVQARFPFIKAKAQVLDYIYVEIEEVVSVFKSKTLQLHTTRSWDFMGLTLDYMSPKLLTTQQQPVYGAHDVIVGIFDTGISYFN